ncbi:MAG: hypothetical protein U5J99_05400 [Parvularculaceae bacterium]|nr:hypothetical protein [Parvularculaceae bacterium]
MRSDIAKLVICVAIDVIDFTIIAWLPGVGLAVDAINTVVAVLLFGPIGLVALWEAVNLAEPIDAFVPTMTLLAISQMGKARKKAAVPDLPRN